MCVYTSKIHLVSRCPMCLLFTLVTGNCDILECAPVLLIALQCQFLGSVKYITERGRHVRLDDGKKRKEKTPEREKKEGEPLKCKDSKVKGVSPQWFIHFMRQLPQGPPACQQRLEAKNESG